MLLSCLITWPLWKYWIRLVSVTTFWRMSISSWLLYRLQWVTLSGRLYIRGQNILHWTACFTTAKLSFIFLRRHICYCICLIDLNLFLFMKLATFNFNLYFLNGKNYRLNEKTDVQVSYSERNNQAKSS